MIIIGRYGFDFRGAEVPSSTGEGFSLMIFFVRCREELDISNVRSHKLNTIQKKLYMPEVVYIKILK